MSLSSVSGRPVLPRLPEVWQDARGQTTTEWLMIAGVLAAVGIFLQGLLPGTIRQYSLLLMHCVRTIAP